MKKTMFFAVAVVLLVSCFSSCAIAYQIQDSYSKDSLCGQKLYYSSDFEKLTSEKEICDYIAERVKYKKDGHDATGPEETLKRGYGDCKAFSILYMDIAYFAFFKKYSAGAVNTGRKIVEGGTVNHCIVVRPDGSQLEPQSGGTVDYKLGYIFSFDEVFSGGF